ncbi:hypothetical protein [Tuberibacillus calidus]|jgi:hypothetical protein|uniref:hypothetical protein n=1 Tax=Tuberibacillus calidus TaxID=340097 RepID=UPI0003FF08D8|nr:hypothetical protein [Tuberibacillus calidus]
MADELIKNQVIKDAVQAELKNSLVFSNLAGVVEENFDLKGAGAGDTITFTQFDLSNVTLQALNRGDSIEVDELSQSSFQVTIEQLATGKRFYDQDIKYNVSGGSLEAEAVRHIQMAFANGMDDIALNALDAKALVNQMGTLTVSGILDAAEDQYGERTYKGGIAALAIHPRVLKQLRADSEFERAASYMTPNPDPNSYPQSQAGFQEVGRLAGLIPVVIFDKIPFDAENNIYHNLLIPKNSILSVIGKDMNVERKRVPEKKATEIYADSFAGVAVLDQQPWRKAIRFEA